MRLDEVRLVKPLHLELRAKVPGVLPPLATGAEVRLRDDLGTMVLRSDAGDCDVEAARPEHAAELRGLVRRDLPTLAWVQGTPGGATPSLLVGVIEANLRLVSPDPWVFVVNPTIKDDLERRHLAPTSNARDLSAWLHGRLVIAPTASEPSPRFLVSTQAVELASSGRPPTFRIWGKGLAVDVRWSDGAGYRVERVLHSPRVMGPDTRGAIVIVCAPVAFRDEAEVIGSALRQALEAHLAGPGQGYLAMWQVYQDIERKLAEERRAAVGHLRYTSASKHGDGWHFTLPSLDDVLERLGEQEVVLEAHGDDDSRQRGFAGRVDRRASRSDVLVLTSEDKDAAPPPQGVLAVSLRGEETIWKRRDDARRRIAESAPSSIPVGAILEGLELPSLGRRQVDPMSPAVRAIFGVAGPTEKQRKALHLALNTPDIAIIQGPPGTGKTQVIRALALRLSELDEGEAVRGGLLLSSYQHEAVEHVAGTIQVFGLPAVKLGGRRGKAADRTSAVDTWRIAQRDRLPDEGGESGPLRRAIADARAAFCASHAPLTAAAALSLVERTTREHLRWLTRQNLEDGLALQGKLERQVENERWMVAEKARLRGLLFGLRTSAAGWVDDGPARVGAVRRHAAELGLSAEDDAWLDDLRLEDELAPQAATRIIALRDKLLDRVTETVSVLPRAGARADVSVWLGEVVYTLDQRSRSLPDDAPTVVADFRAALDEDAEAVAEALAHYTSVLAATCLQSTRPDVIKAAGASHGRFKSVVIDEAARANPLDLLVPMSLAQRRIVLVGDHRQLPHGLEPDIERELDRDPKAELDAALRQSLFERLKLQLERQGRVVTLDRQFRMHPVLADFVSDTFYRPHHESFDSGVGGDERGHALADLEGAVAAWLEVPHRGRGEARRAGSLCRPREAELIAETLERWLNEQPELSFGVITFYSAQVSELWGALGRRGLALGREVEASYRSLPNGRERLRIGTVDAFQGKEFDVVLLSQVRSNDRKVDEDPRTRRGKWGFLMLDNRMCVALSRQRRALVVVGDSAMVQGQEAEQAVPGLARFYQLCGGPHGRILGS